MSPTCQEGWRRRERRRWARGKGEGGVARGHSHPICSASTLALVCALALTRPARCARADQRTCASAPPGALPAARARGGRGAGDSDSQSGRLGGRAAYSRSAEWRPSWPCILRASCGARARERVSERGSSARGRPRSSHGSAANFGPLDSPDLLPKRRMSRAREQSLPVLASWRCCSPHARYIMRALPKCILIR